MCCWLWMLWVFLASFTDATNSPLVNLQEHRVTATYRDTLNKAFLRFRDWCCQHRGIVPEDFKRDPEQLNKLLIDHVQFLYEERLGVSAGRHAVLSIHHKFPLLRPFLRESWDSIKSWEQLAPVKLRTPMPPLVHSCMFIFSLLMGFQSTGPIARDWISFAVGLLCCFEGLLRPGEWCALRCGQVAVPAQRFHGLVKNAMLTVLNGKNRRVFGRIQIAMLDEGRGVDWLTWLVSGLDKKSRLFHGGTGKFRKLFAVAVKALRLESLGLTPASLRAGGATFLFVSGSLDIGRIQYRGRWASLSTLQHYLQEASAQLAMLQLSDPTVQRLLEFHDRGRFFDEPPSQPWSAFFSRPPPGWMKANSSRRSALRRR